MRLTTRGRHVAIITALLWTAALSRPSLASAGAALIGSLALAFAIATISRPHVKLERSLPRDRYTEGEHITDTVRLTLVAGRSLEARVHEGTTSGLRPLREPFEVLLRPRLETVLAFELEAETWGKHEIGPLHLTVSDAFGLFAEDTVVGSRTPLRVHPRKTSVGRFQPRASNPEAALGAYSVQRPGDSAEFFTLREYRSGDSIRRMNWKATARANRPIVNQATRDSYARILILLDLREKETMGGPPSAAIRNGRACAALLEHHSRTKDHMTVLILGKGATTAADSPNAKVADLLDGIVDAPLGGSGSLTEALRQHAALIKPRSPVYLLTSAALDTEIETAVEMLLSLQARPSIISPSPATDPELPIEDQRAIRVSRATSLARLRGLSCPVVDWPTEIPLEVALANG